MQNNQLTEYITQFQNMLIDTDIIAIKDCNSDYQFASSNWLKLNQLQNLKEIIGKNDRTLFAHRSRLYLKTIEELDHECLVTKKQVIAHTLLASSEKMISQLFMIQKNLIIRNSKILGIRDIYRPILTRNYMYKLLEKFMQQPDQETLQAPPQLTQREQIILFLLIIGYSPKLIAMVLENYTTKSISSKTISNIIYQQLYPKFKVNSLDQLTKAAMLLNLGQDIPLVFQRTDFIVKIS